MNGTFQPVWGEAPSGMKYLPHQWPVMPMPMMYAPHDADPNGPPRGPHMFACPPIPPHPHMPHTYPYGMMGWNGDDIHRRRKPSRRRRRRGDRSRRAEHARLLDKESGGGGDEDRGDGGDGGEGSKSKNKDRPFATNGSYTVPITLMAQMGLLPGPQDSSEGSHRRNNEGATPKDQTEPKASILDPNKDLLQALSTQLEYYFSVDNLVKDLFLRNNMDSRGYVDVSVLAPFNRIQQLTSDKDSILLAAKRSPLLKVRGESIRVRENPQKWLFPQPQSPQEQQQAFSGSDDE